MVSVELPAELMVAFAGKPFMTAHCSERKHRAAIRPLYRQVKKTLLGQLAGLTLQLKVVG